MSYLMAVSASPRRGGNSEIILDAFCEGAARAGLESKVFRLNEMKISPCQACDRCAVTVECAVHDDMQQLYETVKSAAALVIATPIFFGSMAAQLKMFIDRFQCWWHAKYNLKKPFINLNENRPGFFICVGALRNPEYCKNAEGIIRVFFHNLNFHHTEMLCFQGYDEKGSIRKDPGTVEKALQSGLQFTRRYIEKPEERPL